MPFVEAVVGARVLGGGRDRPLRERVEDDEVGVGADGDVPLRG